MTDDTRTISWLMACSGMIAGPLLWAMNTELGQIFPSIDCGSQLQLTFAVSLVALLIALAGGYVSWRLPVTHPTLRFVSRVSVLLSLMFVFALFLQATAGWMISGCQR